MKNGKISADIDGFKYLEAIINNQHDMQNELWEQGRKLNECLNFFNQILRKDILRPEDVREGAQRLKNRIEG